MRRRHSRAAGVKTAEEITKFPIRDNAGSRTPSPARDQYLNLPIRYLRPRPSGLRTVAVSVLTFRNQAPGRPSDRDTKELSP